MREIFTHRRVDSTPAPLISLVFDELATGIDSAKTY
jgi:hypothetical protein